jgi:hypothetical protein
MLPQSENELRKCKFRETARASYPGGMSMFKTGIVIARNKQQVSDFFVSDVFFVPEVEAFKSHHGKLCDRLSQKINLNIGRTELKRVTVAAKFIDTFLYHLMKFEEYRKLWTVLHLIVDSRLIRKLKKYGDKSLIAFLKNYPNSPYEASYSQYLELQDYLDEYIRGLNSPFIKNKIELNFLWAEK